MMDKQLSHNRQKELSEKNSEAFEYEKKINYMLFDISNAISTTHDLEELYRFIYETLNKLLVLPNFFIALYDEATHTLNFEYFVDEYDEGLPVIKNSQGPNSLTGEIIQNGQALFLKENMLLERAKNNRLGGTIPKVWLGAPLVIHGKTIGAVCIQHYTKSDYFSHKHLDLLVCLAAQLATAIERKQILYSLEKEKKTLRIIADNTRSIVSIVDSNWGYEFANPAHENLGYDPFSLQGTSFIDLVHPDDSQTLLAFLEKGIQENIFHTALLFRIKDKAGIFRQLEGNFELIRDNESLIKRMIFIGRETQKETKKLPGLKNNKKSTFKENDSPDKNRTILIIEDEDTVRAVAVRTLKSFGYNCLEANDGENAIRLYKNSHQDIDAVLLDIILPGISGAQTFEEIIKINPHAEIIITSGHITSQDQEERFSNAAAYIEKPYQIMALKETLSAVLS